MKTIYKLGMGASACAVVAVVYAATALRFGAEVNVSQTPSATEKAKAVRLAYQDGAAFKKAWIFTYGDGPAGQQNVYARYSFDDGANWSAPVLLSRDAANSPTGGQVVRTRQSLAFVADNDKPSIFAPPVTTGPKVVITWNSAYCPQDPAAGNNSGAYGSGLQGAGDLDGDGVLDRPYHCVWVATSTDPTLAKWDVQQLTNGERDAIGEVVSGNSTGTAFSLAWQEDPAGLQPGEAEGRGDGGSGATVSGGTNIWYTHAPSPSGSTLRSNVAMLSDNQARGTGQPGASRPNLQVSGSTAVVAYEESACPGGNGGKCIVHHAFPYATHDSNAAGTVVSDVTKNARRVRFVLQGAAAAGSSNLRSVLLWRESPTVVPGAPADIIVRRGFVDTAARPGSNGYLASDILADVPQNMTNLAASGGNANAHRAILRGGLVLLAYDQTPDMNGADPEKTATPTANYNFFVTRSTDEGRAGSWTNPLNLSRIESPTMTVVEPRVAPTPATIVNPLTGTPDAGDLQDADVFYVAYATESNALTAVAGRVYLSRTTDQGATFEAFLPVSSTVAGQSESQLRPMPDGSSAMVLWMGEQRIGDAQSKDVLFAVGSAVQLANLKPTAPDASFPAGSQRSLNLTVLNQGTGSARNVVVNGLLPDGLTPVTIGDPASCSLDGPAFSCTIAEVPSNRSRVISMTVSGATEGSYLVTASASSDYIEADPSDNTVSFAVNVTAPVAVPAHVPEPVPPADGGSGGCTVARADAPVDPVLPALVGVGLLGLALRRLGARR